MSLVWVDVETTGLDPQKDLLLEVAIVVTDDNLVTLAQSQWTIHEDLVREDLHPAVVEMHTANGLFDAVEESTLTREDVEGDILMFLEKYVEPGKAPLAGSTISFDRSFLKTHLPLVYGYLHYRNIDVSTIKELVRRWWPEKAYPTGQPKPHRALQDAQDSIRELVYYRSLLTP